MKRKTFYDVLTEAVKFFSENGYTSPEELQYWMDQLEQAAKSSMKPQYVMEQMLQDAFRSIYARLIERGGITKLHPGITRFTLDQVAPQLRSELDRRILSSSQLIKLNREQAIEQTLRRFAGWSTSIPKGGSNVVDKNKVKENVRKSIASLPFNERRVFIDQGHKFSSALSETLSVGGGAIAAVWHSHWRQTGYNYRTDHKERDKKVYLIRDSWAKERGFVKANKNGYVDDITRPGEEVYCRCYYSYLYNLRDLPPDMLTVKGKEALEKVKI